MVAMAYPQCRHALDAMVAMAYPQNGEGFASRLFAYIMFLLVNSAKWGTWGKLSCTFMETNKKGFFLDAFVYDTLIQS